MISSSDSFTNFETTYPRSFLWNGVCLFINNNMNFVGGEPIRNKQKKTNYNWWKKHFVIGFGFGEQHFNITQRTISKSIFCSLEPTTKSESDWSAKIQNFGISCWIRWVRYYHTRELLIYNIKLTYLCNLALHIYDHNRTDSKCFHPFHRIDLEMLMAWSRWNKWHTFYETPCYSKPLFQHETPFHRILDKHFGHPHPTWL